tara:strand:+ start:11349 stop:11834 length:486 start_codon:yes stop_codon:yes gene_type:complete
MCFGPEVAAAFSIGGTLLSALGTRQQGKATQASANYNAAVQRNQAIAAKQKAEFDADKQRQQGAAQRAAARTGFAKGGVALEGTPLLFLESSAEQAELDAQAIIYGGDTQATGFEAQAGLSEMEGASAARAGTMGAGTTLLTGVGQTASAYDVASRGIKIR